MTSFIGQVNNQIFYFGPQVSSITQPSTQVLFGATLDGGSSISGGTFTDQGWRPAGIKWSRRRHDAFLKSTREEARRKLAEEKQLSALGRTEMAERDLRAAQEEFDAHEAEFNRNATRANHTAHAEAKERLESTRAKVNELHSIEYVEKLWADYHADQKARRGRN